MITIAVFLAQQDGFFEFAASISQNVELTALGPLFNQRGWERSITFEHVSKLTMELIFVLLLGSNMPMCPW